MFKIFVGENCRICQLYWCFHRSICSKTRQRDLRNCPQHPKRDLSKGDTVWWAYKTACFWVFNETSKDGHVYDLGLCKFVASKSFLQVNRDAAKGLQCPKETRTCKIWMGRKSIGGKFFQTTMTHVITFFASFPLVKQEYVWGNTGCIGFFHLFIGFPSVMVVIANFWTRWWLGFAHEIGHTEE